MPQEPLQWGDLTPRGRQIVSANMREAGLNVTGNVEHQIERAKERTQTSKTPEGRKLADRAVRVWSEMSPHVRDQPVTLQSAADSRQGFFERALDQTPGTAWRTRTYQGQEMRHLVQREPGQIPEGAGWYFNHNRQITDSALRQGGGAFERDNAIVAANVMSPQNPPENERAAADALMNTFAEHTVHVTQDVADFLGSKGIDVQHHVGKEVSAANLPRGSVAHLSQTSFRPNVPTRAPLEAVSKGGTKKRISQAEGVLWGDIDPDEAIDPHGAPKVWSYSHNTRLAEPNTPTHVEYMTRMAHHAKIRAGLISPQQETFDLYGLQDSREGILNPEGHTAEDSWMHSMTMNQPQVNLGKTSVFKTAGSMSGVYPPSSLKTRTTKKGRESAHPNADVKGSALAHAFNNRATHMAAAQASEGTHLPLPGTAMQEVSWTQARREAEKDTEYNEQQREEAEHAKQVGLQRVNVGGADYDRTAAKGQTALWGPHNPGRAVSPGADEAPEMSAAEQEADLRKWGAIGNNSRRKRDRQARLVRGAQAEAQFRQEMGL